MGLIRYMYSMKLINELPFSFANKGVNYKKQFRSLSNNHAKFNLKACEINVIRRLVKMTLV